MLALVGAVGVVVFLAIVATARPLGAVLLIAAVVVVGLLARRLGGVILGRPHTS